MFEVVDTGLPKSLVPASGAVKAGKMYYSVHIPRDPETGGVFTGDMETQMRYTLDSLKMSVEAAGGSMGDIVQVVNYLIDPDDFAVMNEVYKEYFKEPYPTRATIVAKALLAPGLRIEMVVTGVLG
ncbi:MAG: RidA family protein [Nitratireductor sp.]|nr:RidA family protein [Nitratireductor sp.]